MSDKSSYFNYILSLIDLCLNLHRGANELFAEKCYSLSSSIALLIWQIISFFSGRQFSSSVTQWNGKFCLVLSMAVSSIWLNYEYPFHDYCLCHVQTQRPLSHFSTTRPRSLTSHKEVWSGFKQISDFTDFFDVSAIQVETSRMSLTRNLPCWLCSKTLQLWLKNVL